ncbi:MAG: FAD-linked oxidase C-terminal domain-containing protein [Thermodesulfobacteriota bacterium]
MDATTLHQLQAIVGRENVTVERADLLCYSYDGSNLEYPPEAVVFPSSAAEISAIMRLATEKRIPVVVRGAGTGMTGGALAVAGGIVLATSRMNRILEIDTDNHLAVVEPGVLNGDLKQAAARHGLFYPPDPASYSFCTLGGNVAEGAGGPAAVKYGVTRDYVLALEVVLADGRILHTGERTAKGVVGYDLTRLFTGSEGTLGIITKITVRLLPLPTARATLLLLCTGPDQAARLVNDILARATPCALEFMDRTAIAIVRDKFPFPLPEETGALLLVELDGDRDSVEQQADRLTDYLAGLHLPLLARAKDDEERRGLWNARRAISPASFTLKPHKLGEDVVVPRSRIPELVTATARLAAENGLPIFSFGHAGDGNLHVNIMYDRDDDNERQRARAAKERLFRITVELGGTISGEHGVGITKAPYISLERDAVFLDVMRDLKRLFDPHNILNPGKILPAEG